MYGVGSDFSRWCPPAWGNSLSPASLGAVNSPAMHMGWLVNVTYHHKGQSGQGTVLGKLSHRSQGHCRCTFVTFFLICGGGTHHNVDWAVRGWQVGSGTQTFETMEAVCILWFLSPFFIFKVNTVPSLNISFFTFASAATPSSETLASCPLMRTQWWLYRAQVENSGYLLAPNSELNLPAMLLRYAS